MRNTRIIGLFVIAVIALSVIWAVSLQGTPQANAQDNRCNTSNVAGSYAYTAFGTILPGQPLGAPAGPYTTAGVVTLNKDGTYSLRAHTSYSGTFLEENGDRRKCCPLFGTAWTASAPHVLLPGGHCIRRKIYNVL